MKAILKVASFQTGLFLIWVFIALMAIITWFAIGMVMAIVGGDHFDSALFFLYGCSLYSSTGSTFESQYFLDSLWAERYKSHGYSD